MTGLHSTLYGGILSVRDGANAQNNNFGMQDRNDETWWIPAGSASVIESTFPSEGLYVGVDHAMKDVVKGGAFAVLAAANSTDTDHPSGQWCHRKAVHSLVCPLLMPLVCPLLMPRHRLSSSPQCRKRY